MASTDSTTSAGVTPFEEFDRASWSRLARFEQTELTEAELHRIRGLGDRIDLREVQDVYLPLSRLLSLYAANAKRLHQTTSDFLGTRAKATPFVIGVAGSVAVGKSTVARLLRELLSRWPDTPHVELVTTDGFLYPNAELERRGLMQRKGFPESYDRRALLRFVSRVKSGMPEVRAPYYSHLSYDIVPGAEVVVRSPDVLIVEGLNVLQPPLGTLALSDLFDFSIYVDARTSDIENWYVERFLALKQQAFANPSSYFHNYADLTDDEARERAISIWHAINEPNLELNVKPTRSRATLVLRKEANHNVHTVLLRKL